jgi:phosphatidylcholine synthase
MQLFAALVHVLTASGAVVALFALVAVIERSWETAFLWLGLAFVIDGIDGTIARWVRVTERTPRFSGERLDLVVDYVTYVFVPAYALLAAGFLKGPWGMALAAAILLSSLYHFADTESKAEDYSFVGFPAVWNIVAFYLFVFAAPPELAMVVVAICAVLTFVPMKWVHPMRVMHLRGLVIAGSLLWSAAALTATWTGFANAPAWTLVVLLAVAAATVLLSIVSSWRATA